MLFNTLFLSGLAALAAASPIAPQHVRRNCNVPAPVLPVNGGDKELPSSGNATLKYILLGFGIQNYTCESTEATAASIGAVAMLYDVTPLYPGQGPQSLTIEAFNELTTTTLHNKDIPLNLLEPPLLGADPSEPFLNPGEDLVLDSVDAPIPFVGHHFFNINRTPQFKVSGDNGDVNFLATKLDSATAPGSADVGPDGTGAVGWLYLGAGEGTVGGSYVYRVITAGGNSHGCAAGNAVDSTSYTTQYWIFA
jgi:hypothetical protein